MPEGFLTTRTIGARSFTLRDYGHPGKYEDGLVIDEFVDNEDWFNASEGTTETGGHYGLIRGSFDPDNFSATWQTRLTDDERAFLCAIGGAIVHTGEQGFVTVAYYNDEESLLAAWAELEAAYVGDDDVPRDSEVIESSDLHVWLEYPETADTAALYTVSVGERLLCKAMPRDDALDWIGKYLDEMNGQDTFADA